jgi:glycine cleavage system aminomethyltransferase T
MNEIVRQSRLQTDIKRSPLLGLHQSRGATLIEHDHWLLPVHFGDPLTEYDAVRNHVGILDLCQRNLLRFTGDDRRSFLNSLVSNDVNALTAGQGLHACFVDLQGSILADARIFCGADFLIVDIPEPRKQTILRYLQRPAAAKDVETEDLSADYSMLSIQGPHAQRLVTELASRNDLSLVDLTHLQVTIADATVILIAVTHGAELGYDLVIPATKLPEVVSRIEEVGKHWSLSWVGIEAQEILRIEAGIPLYGMDISEKNLLLESGQDRWISFNRQFAGFILESKQPVQTGAKIYDGEREIGSITSCRFSPGLEAAVALGYIRRDYLAPRTRVMIRDGGKSLLAIISMLPIQ